MNTTTPVPAPLSDEWLTGTMFDHLAICAIEPDKQKRIELYARFGHQVLATLTAKESRITVLEEALRHIADDADEFSHGDDNAQSIVRGFASRAAASLSPPTQVTEKEGA